MKYVFTVSNNKVICVSHYAGKPVRGIAKCDPQDEFSVETGKNLAKLRCDFKVAKKRLKRANIRCNEAIAAVESANRYFESMLEYRTDASQQFETAEEALVEFERTLA